MRYYKILDQQTFTKGIYSIVPIRHEDRYHIMRWRNEQIYHLRQSKPLTSEDQDNYFDGAVKDLFEKEKPEQILFSYLENEKCIGYGGLVHINWKDRNAEISFIMDTSLEADYFSLHWHNWIAIISEVAFKQLGLHKIYTWAFDLRPHLYLALESAGMKKEAVLKEQCCYNGKYLDVVIHSITPKGIFLRPLVQEDREITYHWATDPEIRKFSFSRDKITFEQHLQWLESKRTDPDCFYYIFIIDGNEAGSIRFDVSDHQAVISYLLAPDFHGKGYGTKLLELGMKTLLDDNDKVKVFLGKVIKENKASVYIFNKLGYLIKEEKESVLTFEKRI
jgi:RimJ/RimL family protein N-acetyltransferase